MILHLTRICIMVQMPRVASYLVDGLPASTGVSRQDSGHPCSAVRSLTGVYAHCAYRRCGRLRHEIPSPDKYWVTFCKSSLGFSPILNTADRAAFSSPTLAICIIDYPACPLEPILVSRFGVDWMPPPNGPSLFPLDLGINSEI